MQSFETTTSEDGHFAFAKAPPGSFDAFQLDPSPTRNLGTIEIHAGRTNEVLLGTEKHSAAR